MLKILFVIVLWEIFKKITVLLWYWIIKDL